MTKKAGRHKMRAKKYGENYDLSMSDLFAGFLFIFILLLVFFLVQLQQEKSKPLQVRHKLLQKIKKEFSLAMDLKIP